MKYINNLEINSIYDFDNALSINELLCKFWEKIEEVINISNESIDILNWIKEEGLPDELQVLINQLVADGTIEQMINVDKLNELRNLINMKYDEMLVKHTEITNKITDVISQMDTIDSEKASKVEVDVERKRIDNLINISTGEIDNVEISDARIGANGVLYDNLGNAIRLQLNEKIDGDIPNNKYYWEKGGLSATGELISYANETHSRTKTYLPKRLQSVTNKGSNSFHVLEYEADGNFSEMITVTTNNSYTFSDDKIYKITISTPYTQIDTIVNDIVFSTKPNKYEALLNSQNLEITNIKNKVNSINIPEKINLKKLLCIGDSLTQGDYGSNPPGNMNVKTENYPYYLSKYLNKFITVDVVNAGKCGFTSTNYWESKVKTIDFTDVKTIVIMLGTNGYLTDTLETDTNITEEQTYYNYANTHTGSYCKIIEYCLEKTSNLSQIILVTPPKTNQRVENSMITTVEVIKKIGKNYGLPVIDGYNEFGISPTNFNTMLPIDGLHGGKIAYKKIATFIGSNILSKLSYEIED